MSGTAPIDFPRSNTYFFVGGDHGSGDEGDNDNKSDYNNENGTPPGHGRRSRTSSVGSFTNPAWPQSYRESIGFQIVSSPIPRVGSSIFSSSFRRGSVASSYENLQTAGGSNSRLQDLEHEANYRPIYNVPSEASFPLLPSVHDVDRLRAEYGSSFTQALLNGLNVLAGVGILSTPYAVKEGGFLGIFILFGLAAICCYTGILLRRCLDYVRKNDSESEAFSYPDIGQAAFGSTGRLIVSIILYVELYACCVEFIILEGDNLSTLFPNVSLHIGGLHLDSQHFFCIVAALLILPTVWLRDLSVLSYLSAGGVIATLVVLLSVFWVGAFNGVGFTRGTGPMLNLATLPVSIGLYGFCYSGHAVFPNVYMSMKKPDDFNRVLQVSFVIVSLIYGGMAVMGITMFGDDTLSSITLNLPKEFTASKIAVWTTIVNPITKFALTMTPVALSLEELLPDKTDSREARAYSLLIRTGLVLSTVGVAILIPFFGLVMAFIGAFLSMTVSLILPCMCYLRIIGDSATISQRLLCGFIIMVGLLCAFGGTYSSVAEIVRSYLEM